MKKAPLQFAILGVTLLALTSFTLTGREGSGEFPHAKKKSGSTYKVVIDKSDYELKVYDEDGWYGTYPVVFGDPSLADKKMEGDKLTPEGTFHIVAKKIHKKWGPFLLIDYPNSASYARFNQLKAEHKIPAKSSIGGGIGIHGTRPNEEYAVDNFINWTDGCISVKYSDIAELYDMLPVGTEVIIQK